MDRQLTIIKKVVVGNSTNEDEISSWTEIDNHARVWGKIDQRPGREVVIADQIQSIINTTFVIDWRDDITEENRIVMDTKVYNIISISIDESSRKGYLFLNAELIPKLTWTES